MATQTALDLLLNMSAQRELGGAALQVSHPGSSRWWVGPMHRQPVDTHVGCAPGGRGGRGPPPALSESPATSVVLSGERRLPCLLGPCSCLVFLLQPGDSRGFPPAALCSPLCRPCTSGPTLPRVHRLHFSLSRPVARGHLHPVPPPSARPALPWGREEFGCASCLPASRENVECVSETINFKDSEQRAGRRREPGGRPGWGSSGASLVALGV